MIWKHESKVQIGGRVIERSWCRTSKPKYRFVKISANILILDFFSLIFLPDERKNRKIQTVLLSRFWYLQVWRSRAEKLTKFEEENPIPRKRSVKLEYYPPFMEVCWIISIKTDWKIHYYVFCSWNFINRWFLFMSN